MEAAGVEPADAIRFYQHALAALWSDAQNAIRPRVRLELIEFLLRHGQRGRALSELLVLAPTVANEAATRTKLGHMFLQVGESARAAQQYTAALDMDPTDEAALVGAAEAAFNEGQYRRARQWLARVSNTVGRIAELRLIVDLVLTRDPLASRLRPAERRKRLLANLEYVAGRLAACPGIVDAAALQPEIEAQMTTVARRRTMPRDLAEEGMDAVARVQHAVGDACGPQAPLDQALALIAHRHELRTP